MTGVGTAPEKAGGRVIEAGPDAAAEIADLLEEARGDLVAGVWIWADLTSDGLASSGLEP